MITVIIAGGSGTRLWPLSTPDYPKHLLKLTSEKSLLQMAYERAKKIGNDVYVVTEASHSDKVRKQLPDLPSENILVEPGRRGTARCIIFALDAISRHHDKDEPVAFIHSDHQIRDIDGFVRSFQSASKMSSKMDCIALIGIEPTFPSTGFGYIERGDIVYDDIMFKVNSFKEKPDLDLAKKYIASGNYLWNCGYFVGSVNVFLKDMKKYAVNLEHDFRELAAINNFGSDEYNRKYLSFDNQVIDVTLIEKDEDLIVVSANFDWMDVGSFKDLSSVLPTDDNNNYLQGENVHTIEIDNSYVRNDEPTKPIAVIGLNNIVVVNTKNGILISRKDMSQRVGEVAKRIQKKN